MPLPENWNGLFYSKDTQGDLIFDLPPGEFIDYVTAPEVFMGGPSLVANALYDLLRNKLGKTETFTGLLKEAHKRLPEMPLFAIFVTLATAEEMEKVGVSKVLADRVVSNTMATFFGGCKMYG